MRLGIMLLLAGILIVAAACVFSTCAAEEALYGPPPLPSSDQPDEHPRIVLDADTFDLGTFLQGEPIRFEGQFRNEGNETLKVHSVDDGLLTAKTTYTMEVPAGEIGTLSVEFRRATRDGRSMCKRPIVIKSNDPITPELKFRLIWSELRLLTWQPSDVVLEGMENEPVSCELSLLAAEGIDLELIGLDSTKEKVRIDGPVVVTPGEEWKARISGVATTGVSRWSSDIINASVEVQTESGKKKLVLPIQVRFKTRQLIEVSPFDTLSFNRKDTALLKETNPQPVTKDVTIRAGNADVNFKVTGFKMLDVPDGLFSAELKEVKAGSSYRIAVTLKQHLDTRFARGKLVIGTDDATRPTIELKLFAHFSWDFEDSKK